MAGMNVWAVFLTSVVLLVTNEGVLALQFIRAHPSVIIPLLTFGATSAIGIFVNRKYHLTILGQNFIFFTIHEFGALANSLITTTRKFFTIVFSIFFFGHRISSMQWVGVVLVFAALGYELYMKHQDRRIQEQAKTN